jgi:hypothetical protein
MDKKLELVARFVLKQLELVKENPELFDLCKRSIQVAVWDRANTKAFFTGKITKRALETGERVKEHWYGATPLALDIMNMESPTVEKIVNEIKEKLTWNYTTSEENWILANNNQDYSLISELVDYKK